MVVKPEIDEMVLQVGGFFFPFFSLFFLLFFSSFFFFFFFFFFSSFSFFLFFLYLFLLLLLLLFLLFVFSLFCFCFFFFFSFFFSISILNGARRGIQGEERERGGRGRPRMEEEGLVIEWESGRCREGRRFGGGRGREGGARAAKQLMRTNWQDLGFDPDLLDSIISGLHDHKYGLEGRGRGRGQKMTSLNRAWSSKHFQIILPRAWIRLCVTKRHVPPPGNEVTSIEAMDCSCLC